MVSLILIVYFIVVVFFNFYYFSIFHAIEQSYTEFLINFEGGFVRRGLIGQIIYEICEPSHFSPIVAIYAICAISWLGVVVFFFRKFKEKGLCWWLLASPFLLGSTSDFIRKDYLSYLVLIGILYLVANKPRLWHIAGVMLLVIFGIMLHEAFIFYGVPLAVITLMSGKSTRWQGVAVSVLAVAVFMVMCLYKGDAAIAKAISDSWSWAFPDMPLNEGRNYYGLNIWALSWDTVETMKMHLLLNLLNYEYDHFTILIQVPVWLLSYYLFTNFLMVFRGNHTVEQAETTRRRVSALYLMSFFFLLPMFTVLSCDYIRIYQYMVITTYAAYLLLPGDTVDRVVPRFVNNFAVRFNRIFEGILVPNKWLLLILLFVVSASPTNHAIIKSMIHNSILGNLFILPFMLFLPL